MSLKIAIPLAGGAVSAHFGHCPEFAFYEVNEVERSIGSRATVAAPPHEPGLLPRWLAEQGATTVIAGGIGQRAQTLLAQHGIQVIVGAPAQDADKVVADYVSGALQPGDNSCSH